MNEYKKLEEAKYFLEKMITQKKNLKDFENNLSAFLTSSRSVFDYAKEECKINPNSKSWYKLKTSSSPIIEFLRKKRNLNVHVEPIKTNVLHTIEAKVTISVNGTAIVSDKEGNIISQKEFGQKPQKDNLDTIKSDTIYKFTDWSGSEDVITLCNLYINEIENFLAEGQSLNFLT
ncbi:MAG: hypothetical protein M1480_01440 [Bacteroidetes bacterium]|nr:hypothetical protein [Bacteroidota bacterium]